MMSLGSPQRRRRSDFAEPPGVVGCFRQQPLPEGSDLRDLRSCLRTDDPVGVGGPPRQVERPDEAPADYVQAARVVRASAIPWPSIAASINMLARFRTGPGNCSGATTPARANHRSQALL